MSTRLLKDKYFNNKTVKKGTESAKTCNYERFVDHTIDEINIACDYKEKWSEETYVPQS